MGSVPSQIAPRPRAYWLLQGIPPLLFFLSGIPKDDSFWGDIEPEAADKVNSIIKDRERALAAQKLIVSVASRTQDILPASSLQAGITRSLAVCRIARYFSLKGLQEFIEYIEAIIKEQGDNNNFDSVDKLKEIFLIPGSVANEIFKKLELSAEVQESVQFLESLKNISESQLSKLNPIPLGTGFLVGGTYLLTNCHVIPDKKVAKQCVAQFNYVEDDQGYTKTSVDYEFDSETLFIPELALDYTIVQLKTSLFTQQPGYKYGWIQLVEDDENILPGDGIFVIHHPKGKPKKIDLSNNEVIANGLYKNFLRYQADTDYGSSGSPIFNNKWELVALHHAVVPDVVPKNINQEYDQPQVESQLNPAQEKSVVSTNVKDKKEDAQQGIRICRIIEDLKKKSFSNPKLKSFIEDFVVTSEQLNYPPLPSGLEFDGQNSYVDIGTHESLDITDAITVEAWVRRQPDSEDGMIVSRSGAYFLYGFQGRIWVCLQQSSEKSQKITGIEGFAFKDSLWHHIAFAWNSESKDIQIFLDGKRQNNIKWEENWDFNDNGNSNNNLKISIDSIQKGINPFSGYIAEVRLWKLARTEAQIRADMYRRLPGNEMGLIGYWRFEEGESYKVCNLAKSDADSLQNIDIDPFIAAQPTFGMQLNGSGNYIDGGDYESLKIDKAITLEAWFKTNDNPGVIVNRGGAWVENGYSLFWLGKKIRVELQNINQKQKTGVETEELVLKLDEWHHVAFTWDKESKTIQIYVDGVKQETTFVGSSKPFEGPIGEPRLRLNIGRSQDYGYYFNGSIAEVRLWKIAQTEEQIKENMTRLLQGKETGLVGLWRLDEEEGDRAKNLVSESDGIAYGGRWLKPYSMLAANQSAYGVVFRTRWLRASQHPHAAPPLPFGLKFNEEKAYIDCGNGEGLDTPAAITVEAWVKHKFGNCVIVSRGGIVKPDGSLEKGYSLAWYDGKIHVALSDGTLERTIVYSKENAPADSVWHHIAFTWEQSSQEIAIYINGRRQDSVVEGKSHTILFQGQSKSIGLFAGLIDNLSANLIIGLKEAKETYYNVAITEVRLWNVCRAQDRIKADMSRRLKGTEDDGLLGYWRLDDGGEGNKQVRNLVSDKNHGTIYGATWWNPVREITDTENKGDSTDNPPETPPSNQTS